MTKQLAMADLHKFLLGFDRFMEPNTFAPTLDGGYPRYNVLKVGDSGFRVELAVPGWNKMTLKFLYTKAYLLLLVM